MCFVSTPKIPNSNPSPPQYLHNTFVDGTAALGSTQGRNSLRVDLNNREGSLNAPVVSQSGSTGVPTAAPAVAGIPAIGRQATPSVAGIPAIAHPAAPQPGMVIPTVGGALAGSVPASVNINPTAK